MLSILKKIFFGNSKEENEQVETIHLNELEDWFKKKSDSIISDLNVKIDEIKASIRQEITRTKDNLAVLATAKLRNPNISVKERQLMEGNRKAYILGVNRFLREIVLDVDYNKMMEFCNNFSLRIERFGKGTVRPYAILQDFFANESRNIALNIKGIESLIKKLQTTLEEARLSEIDEIMASIRDLCYKVERKEKDKAALGEKMILLSKLEKTKSKIESEIGNLRKSEEYKKLNQLRLEEERVLSKIKENEIRLVNAFSIINKPLRKMERVVLENAEILAGYIENPVRALEKDDGLKIIEILKKLENNINNYTLDLKDKKREKVLIALSNMGVDFFKSFRNNMLGLKKELERLKREIENNNTFKEEQRLNYELESVKDNLEKTMNLVEDKKKAIEKLDINKIKNELEEKISSFFDTKISISIA